MPKKSQKKSKSVTDDLLELVEDHMNKTPMSSVEYHDLEKKIGTLFYRLNLIESKLEMLLSHHGVDFIRAGHDDEIPF